jgi:nitrogenase molybdenum-iron protein alpha/beta subunit
MDHAPGHGASEAGGAQGAPTPAAMPPVRAVEVEPTGIEAVDRVLAEVAALADRPVAEHVQVFEHAHEQLRRALDARPDSGPDGEQSA